MTFRYLAPALLLAASAASAQTVTLGQLPCLPTGENAAFTAQIEPQPPAENSVRLYFRRLNIEVEDFYYVVMTPTGGGNFWGVFPQPENSSFPKKELKSSRSTENLWAQWWRAKEASQNRDPNSDLDTKVIQERAQLGKLEKRDWLTAQDDAAFERWLLAQTTEPAEFFVAVVDPSGRQVARSHLQAVEVRKDCRAPLTPQQAGAAMNLTIGETSAWQVGKPVFHWECTGIVTRLDRLNVLRADDACRACVIAWWPVAAGAGALGLVAVTDEDPGPPGEISPSRP
jgi:hypothetical protein